MAEARVIKFCTHADYIVSHLKDGKTPLKGRGQCHVTRYLILPQSYLRNC